MRSSLLCLLLLTACTQIDGSDGSPRWRSLFNGLDLTGWKLVGGGSRVRVEDGQIIGQMVRGTTEHTFVTTTERFRDFIFEGECRDVGLLHTGFLLRCVDAAPEAKVRLLGYQVKIDPTPRSWTGGIFDDFGKSWIWLQDLAGDDRARAAYRHGEWNRFRIEAIGPAIKVWVNGVPVAHLLDERYQEGYLALKVHSLPAEAKAENEGYQVSFRNLQIITDRPAASAMSMDLPPRTAQPPVLGKAGDYNPAEHLPPTTRRLTWFGERADWSHDGRRILFLGKTFGDVFEVEVATGRIRALTHHFPHPGFTRALYLANGDILLSGPQRLDSLAPGEARRECWLSVLSKDLKTPPVPLGVQCFEGPVPSRTSLRLAWTQVASQYPQELPAKTSRIMVGNLVYHDGVPRLEGARVVLESSGLPFWCSLEAQNFIPPAEDRMTFSAYGYQGGEVMVLDLSSGQVVNHTNAPDFYDEPEGVFPDGRHTLVESDRHRPGGMRNIDLYKLRLDGSGTLERLTHFNDTAGYKASNGVVSDDGRYLAFQMGRSADPAGVGHGIFIAELRQQQ